MADQSSGGTSRRMTGVQLVGARRLILLMVEFYDQAADTYTLDEEMAEELQEANLEAFVNIAEYLANGQGFLAAGADTCSLVTRELCS